MGRSRRDALRALAVAGAPGLAGCGGGGGETPTGTGDSGTVRPSDSPTDPTTDPTSTDDPPAELVLRPHEAVPDAPLAVFPAGLRDWLREAARTGGSVRGHESVPVYAPDPLVAEFRTVDLRTPGGELDGTFEVRAEGGPRYELRLSADPVESVPTDGTVTEVSSLPADRRELAVDAIEGNWPGAYPETERGEWVREEFFGGHFEREGRTYLGSEAEQTDAAFFSTTVWTVLSMTPVEDDGVDADPVALRFPEIGHGVRAAVEDALADWEGTGREGRAWLEPEHRPEAVAAFAAGTGALLTHTAAFSVAVE
ncbi:hypothetical protein [Halorarum salinum]|uniref:Uncharacterized protein n=1 Tax=Halorarum salinum TaxID=2743089 RepID=A0A7D5L8M2_9EURY|nr:hypothetical protein [Halobaculum salinum]QLG60532.1 hypothetical protein HUG12_01730 [Halobaculum salinum]